MRGGTVVFFGVLAALLLVYSGVFRAIDELALYNAAEQLVVYGEPLPSARMPQLHWAFHGAGKAGVGDFEPGYVFFTAPFLLAGSLIQGAGLIQVALLSNQIVTAATAAIIYSTLRTLGYCRKARIVTTLIYILGTQALYYSTTFFREPLVGLCLLIATAAVYKASTIGRNPDELSRSADNRGIGFWISLAMLALAVAIITKISTLAAVPAFALVVGLVIARSRAQWGPPPILVLGVLAAACTLFLGGAIYGSLIVKGISGGRVPPIEQIANPDNYPQVAARLFALLAGARNGLITYSPALGLSVFGIASLWRRSRLLALAIIGESVGLVGLYALDYSLPKEFVWGTRYLVPLMPLWALLLAPTVQNMVDHPRAIRICVPALIISLSVVIQLASVAINVYPFLAESDWHELVDYGNAPVVKAVRHWLSVFPSSDTLLWLQVRSSNGFGLHIPTITAVITLIIVVLAVWRAAQPGGPLASQHRARLALVATTGIFVFGIVQILEGYSALLWRYESVRVDWLRAAAAFINVNAEKGDIVAAVSNAFQFNALQNFRRRDLAFYWFSSETHPLDPETDGLVEKLAVNSSRVWLVLDRLSQVSPESGIEYKLLQQGYRIEERWFGDYRVVAVDVWPFSSVDPSLVGLSERAPSRGVMLGGLAQLGNYMLRVSERSKRNTLYIELIWQAYRVLPERYTVFVHLLDGKGQVFAQQDSEPAQGIRPSLQWETGEVIVDRHAILLPQGSALSDALLEIGAYETGYPDRLLSWTTRGGTALGPYLRLPLLPPQEPSACGIHLGPWFALQQARLAATEDRFQVQVSLLWQARELADKDYTVFVHLLGDNGQIVAQHDGQPRGGQLPTTVWLPGETVLDEHVVSLDPVLLQRVKMIAVGMYDLKTGARVKLVRGDGDTIIIPIDALRRAEPLDLCQYQR